MIRAVQGTNLQSKFTANNRLNKMQMQVKVKPDLYFSATTPDQPQTPFPIEPDRKRMYWMFTELAQIPSPSDHEAKVREKIKEYLREVEHNAFSQHGNNFRLREQEGWPPEAQRSAPYSEDPYFIEDPYTHSLFIYVPENLGNGSTNQVPLILFDTHMDTYPVPTDRKINVLRRNTADGDTIFHTDGNTILGADAKTSVHLLLNC